MSIKNYLAKKFKLDELTYQMLCCSYYLYYCDNDKLISFEDYCDNFKTCLSNREYLTNIDKPTDFYSLGGEK